MSIDIVAQNAARGLTYPARAEALIATVAACSPDVVVWSEATDKSGETAFPDVPQSLGYLAVRTEYDDEPPHPSQPQFLEVWAKKDIVDKIEPVRLASRTALLAHVRDRQSGVAIGVIGAHFDDRDPHARAAMSKAVVNNFPHKPRLVLAGDVNGMHGRDRRAALLNRPAVQMVARHLPNARGRSLATRLVGMADGAALALLEQAGFHDADPKLRPTMRLGKFAVVGQLDHIMLRQLWATGFRLLNTASDHAGIFARIVAEPPYSAPMLY